MRVEEGGLMKRVGCSERARAAWGDCYDGNLHQRAFCWYELLDRYPPLISNGIEQRRNNELFS